MKSILIIKESAHIVFANRDAIFKALTVPFAAVILCGFVQMHSNDERLLVLIELIEYAVYIVVAIAIHRLLLLGPNSIEKPENNSLTRRQFSFFAYMIGLVFLTTLLLSVLVQFPYIGITLGVLAFIYLTARLSLVFPAIAIDEETSFSDSWNLTKNHQFTMIVITSIFPLILEIPQLALSYLPYSVIAGNIVFLISTVFVVAALSSSYKHIKENNT